MLRKLEYLKEEKISLRLPIFNLLGEHKDKSLSREREGIFLKLIIIIKHDILLILRENFKREYRFSLD